MATDMATVTGLLACTTFKPVLCNRYVHLVACQLRCVQANPNRNHDKLLSISLLFQIVKLCDSPNSFIEIRTVMNKLFPYLHRNRNITNYSKNGIFKTSYPNTFFL